MLDAFRKTSTRCANPMLQSQIKAYKKWKVPFLNQLRLDVDAGCSVSNKLYSVVAAIRNSLEKVMGAKARLIRGSSSVLQGEL